MTEGVGGVYADVVIIQGVVVRDLVAQTVRQLVGEGELMASKGPLRLFECRVLRYAPDPLKHVAANVGVIVAPLRPDEFAAFVKSEVVRWTDEARAAGIEAK